MKASLHDELMREAGFESDHDLALTRRRERRRAGFLRAARVATVVGAVAAGVGWIVDTDRKTGRLPWEVWLVLSVLVLIGALAEWFQRRMTRDEDAPRRPGLWKRITRPWRDDAR